MTSRHELFRTFLTVLQTFAVVIGIGIAFNEFVLKERGRDKEKIDNTVGYAAELNALSNKKVDDFFRKLTLPQGTDKGLFYNWGGFFEAYEQLAQNFSEELLEEWEKKEPIYYKAQTCLEKGLCDENAFYRFICPIVQEDLTLQSAVIVETASDTKFGLLYPKYKAHKKLSDGLCKFDFKSIFSSKN
ncbi:MAG: hypothetical protein HQ474_01650 [Flammeovirgaceae bacterium]|nr:hypothetical protein [Flammeovirgaceae bacterium]